MPEPSKDHLTSPRIIEIGKGVSPTLFESDHLESCSECLKAYRKRLLAAIDQRAKNKGSKTR